MMKFTKVWKPGDGVLVAEGRSLGKEVLEPGTEADDGLSPEALAIIMERSEKGRGRR